MEGLSWGATYRNFTNAQVAIALPLSALANWPIAAIAYLIPWFIGGCPWGLEHDYATTQALPLVCFWASDHLTLLSWELASQLREAFL